LAEENRLERLVTDFYTSQDSALGRVFNHLPNSALQTLSRRYEKGLSSRLVEWSAAGLLSDRLFNRAQAARDRRLAKLGGALARRRDCGLISYSYYGYEAFHEYGIDRRPKILMQVHPHPTSVREILSKDLQFSELGKHSLLSEQELSADPMRMEHLSKEALLADHCVVTSGFCKKTLIENGVAENRIHVVPYGVDVNDVPDRPRQNSLFRVLFVGQMVQRKGLEYLLKAWRKLRLPNAELVLAGRGRVDKTLLAAFASEFEYVGELTNTELTKLYANSDIFCMPSLVEGFGLVYLEALASGLPIIATPNTGMADLVQNGREGFIVPIRDVEAIAEKLEWAYQNRAALTEMRTAARKLAEAYPWSRFRRAIMAVADQVENDFPAMQSNGLAISAR
jgi:glycosyltransferase involved in cell wall biosynthesis